MSYTLVVVSGFILLVSMPAVHSFGSGISVNPTLPPGIFSVLQSGGTSAINTKTGTYTLGGNSTTFFLSSLLLVPLLIAVVALDFGIFGAYATRREDLNPFSQFVFNVREGFNSFRNRRTNYADYDSHYDDRFYARYNDSNYARKVVLEKKLKKKI